eukprot:1803629-Amphidinium_carterae.1
MQEFEAFFGMRTPSSAVSQNSRLQHTGRMIHDILARALPDSPLHATAVISALDGDGDGPRDELLEHLRWHSTALRGAMQS